jgi:Gram-negative bacterial TonB protein C-terminal
VGEARRSVAFGMSMQIRPIRRFTLCLGIVLIFAGSENAQKPLPRLPQPLPLTKKLPSYPPIARAACAQDSVAVLVDIDSTGKVTATDVVYGHPLLRRVAEASAHEWTFDASKEELGQRREVIRFTFKILPFEVSEKKLKPVWATATDVEIRVHPSEPSCDDCSEKRRRELRRGGCPAQP